MTTERDRLEPTPDQVERLDAASQYTPIYPCWRQRDFDERNPKTEAVVRPGD